MEKELTAIETLQLLKDFVLENNESGLDRSFICGSFDIIEKAAKALEIIKEKGLHYLEADLLNMSYEDYVHEMSVKTGIRPLIDGKIKTKEEFDLLKEVLGWRKQNAK